MSPDPSPAVALYYEPDAHTEHYGKSPDGPAGLMGRQVAGKEFLDAYLTHGRFDTLTAVVRSRNRGDPLVRLCREHPSSRNRARRLRLVPEPEFADTFAAPEPPARVLHLPCPPDARFAWTRQACGGRFALSGVTHTLSSLAAVKALTDLLTAPFEPFDVLVCTSRAVADMVRAVTGAYADFLADRFGGASTACPGSRFYPSAWTRTGSGRRRRRAPGRTVPDQGGRGRSRGPVRRPAVAPREAHPYPSSTPPAGRSPDRHKVFLVFAGWAMNAAIDTAYRERRSGSRPAQLGSWTARPGRRTGAWGRRTCSFRCRTVFKRRSAWSLTEAMASGLPVVGSDWDRYRDLVADGETGFLVPTRMVRGATAEATTRTSSG